MITYDLRFNNKLCILHCCLFHHQLYLVYLYFYCAFWDHSSRLGDDSRQSKILNILFRVKVHLYKI